MKKFLSSLSIFVVLALLSCSQNTRAVKSIYIKPQNEDIFSKEGIERIYYYDCKKNDMLVLSAVINQTEGLFSNSKEHQASWKYSYCGGEKTDIAELKSRDGKRIAVAQNNNLVLNIADIDRLGSYKFYASAGGIETEYAFEIDSTSDLESALEIYYVPEIGADVSEKNKIVIDDEKDLTLSCSTTYAIKASDKLGVLEYENATPESMYMSSKNTGAQEKLELYADTVYITTKEGEGENGVIKVKAGNKKTREYRINTDGLHQSTISLSAPKIELIPIVGGYKAIFTSDDMSVFDSYSTVLKINDEAPIRLIDKYYDEKGEFKGVFYSFTEAKDYNITAYFQKENNVSYKYQGSFSIKENLEDFYMFADTSFIRSVYPDNSMLDEWDMDYSIEVFNVFLPNFGSYSERGILDSDGYVKNFKNARVRITVKADDIQYYDIALNQFDRTHWNYYIKNSTKTDKITFDICIYNCMGSFHSVSTSKTIDINRFSADVQFAYYSDANTPDMALYSVSISNENIISFDSEKYDGFFNTMESNKIPLYSMLYVLVSEDGGKNYYDMHSFFLDNPETREFIIEKPYQKNSSNVIFKAKISSGGWIDCNYAPISALMLRTCKSPSVDYGQDIQDAPNVKKAKITAPYNSDYKVEYIINNSTYPTSSDTWNELKLKNGSGIIDVIKCKEDSTENKIEKTLWLRATDLFDKTLKPSLSAYKITMTKAPKPMNNKSDGYFWHNSGFWGSGITLNLHAPVDGCYIRFIAETENAYKDTVHKFDKKNDSAQVINDWDQCFAAYRYNRFYIAAYTSKVGYIDSDMDLYSGFERSGEDEQYRLYHTRALDAVEKLKEDWRCKYEF